MKKIILMAIMAILVLPVAYAGFCEDFDEADCIANSAKWFDVESCRSRIVCNPLYETYDQFGAGTNYIRCTTKYKDNFSDCIDNPTSFCYDSIAYDMTKSKPCKCGEGYYYMLIDDCGNPVGWSDTCIDISTCDTDRVSSNIITHKDCSISDCDSNTLQFEGDTDMEQSVKQIEVLYNTYMGNPTNGIESFSEPETDDGQAMPEIVDETDENTPINNENSNKNINPEKEANKEYEKQEDDTNKVPVNTESNMPQIEKDIMAINTLATMQNKNNPPKKLSTSLMLFVTLALVFSLYSITHSTIRRKRS